MREQAKTAAERRLWATMANGARAAGLPPCVVVALPATVDILRSRRYSAEQIAANLIPAWRRLIELDGRRSRNG